MVSVFDPFLVRNWVKISTIQVKEKKAEMG